jgi:hypothetical protein
MAQLISPGEVVRGGIARPSPADVALDATLISPHIAAAEYRWVLPTLTEPLYAALLANKGTSTAFALPAYQALWDAHLKGLCAEAALYEAAPFIVIQAGSNGLYLNNNEYGNNAGIDGLKFYQDTLRQRLEINARRMRDWLCSCAAALPAFDSSAAGCPEAGCGGDNTHDLYSTFGVVL